MVRRPAAHWDRPGWRGFNPLELTGKVNSSRHNGSIDAPVSLIADLGHRDLTCMLVGAVSAFTEASSTGECGASQPLGKETFVSFSEMCQMRWASSVLRRREYIRCWAGGPPR